MSTYKAKAIVIKTYRFGEADKIVKLFSLEHGIINSIAKGAFNIKSKFLGRLELYNIIDAELSTGRNFDIITQAEIIETFQNISLDFLKFNYAQILSELILKTQSEKSPSGKLFKLFYFSVKKLNLLKESDLLNFKIILIFFLSNFLKIMGYLPLIKSCSLCGKPNIEIINKYSRKVYVFSVRFGGLLCEGCLSKYSLKPNELGGDVFVFKKEEFEVLENFFTHKFEDIFSIEILNKTADKLFKMLTQYTSFHFDINLGSVNYIKNIQDKIVNL